MKLDILFVDDEQEILDSFKAMLIPFKNDWNFSFASSAKDGFNIIENKHIDLIISDMVMPEIDGLTFLLNVKKKYPEIIRFVLTGHTDYEKAIVSTNVIHQFISKPCTADVLVKKIKRIERIRKYFNNKNVIDFINSIDKIPIIPEIYNKIEMELQKNDVSLSTIGDIISKDIFLTAKILQIVNSAFFSIPITIKDIKNAVKYLGINIIKSIVLASSLFLNDNYNTKEKVMIQNVWEHSLKVAIGVSNLLRNCNFDKEICDDGYLAGLLHDIGKLVMINNNDYLNKMTQFNNYSPEKFYKAEMEIFSTTHTEIGAYLLGVWGLDEKIVDVTAKHHTVDKIDWSNLNLETAVYICDIYINHFNPDINKLKNIFINETFIDLINKKNNEIKSIIC